MQGGNMKNLAALTGAIALVGALGACSSSSSSSSSATHSATASAAPVSGTETTLGKGSAATVSSLVFHLTLTGPVDTTGTTPLGAPPAKGVSYTATTAAGNLVVTADSAGTTTTAVKSTTTCLFAYKSTVPITVDGAKSTGKFAGATGSGTSVVAFSGELPKLSNGQCNQNAVLSAKTAVGTFSTTGKLTLKQ